MTWNTMIYIDYERSFIGVPITDLQGLDMFRPSYFIKDYKYFWWSKAHVDEWSALQTG